MKRTRSLLCLAALLAMLAAGPPMAAAQTYLGEFCWWYTEAVPPYLRIPVSSVPLKAGVTHLGGAYYLVQGHVNRANIGGHPLEFLQATGEVVGDELWLHGTLTREPLPTRGWTARNSYIIQLRLDLMTLTGPFWRIQTNMVSSEGSAPSFGQRYIKGQVIFIGGPSSSEEGGRQCP